MDGRKEGRTKGGRWWLEGDELKEGREEGGWFLDGTTRRGRSSFLVRKYARLGGEEREKNLLLKIGEILSEKKGFPRRAG